MRSRGAIQATILCIRHLYRIVRAGQLRFRLETFGLYFPSPPGERTLWCITPRGLLLLARRTPSYLRWVLEMEGVRTAGSAAWWDRMKSHGARGQKR